MAVKQFRKLQTTDKELNLLQDHLKETLDSLTNNPLPDGHLIKQVALVAGTNVVSHGLGRNYVSWLTGNQSAVASLTYAASADPTKFIAIVASAPCSVDLYVF